MRGSGVDDAGEECLLFGYIHIVFSPHLMLVSVSRVASLDGEKLRLRFEHDIGNLLQRHVFVVRARIVAPAHVHAYPRSVEGGQRFVQNLHVPLGHLLEFLRRFVHVPCVPTHPQIRAITLQDQPRFLDCLVLHSHGLTQSADEILVPILPLVVLVPEERGKSAWGGRGEENSVYRMTELFGSFHHAVDLVLKILQARLCVGGGCGASGSLHLCLLGEGQQTFPALELV
mmetsp:Transcript_67594/g.120385  ORF Transcript_67594/g.120385 Transcript_67594/m.120385 type:complete len:229 (+) Transcript_67594:509-1195(+)